MQRMVLQVLLGISGLLMLFRFGAPALIFGATGPGPFGNRWLAEGNTATLLLDSDLRFFGAMMLGLGAILLLGDFESRSFRISDLYSCLRSSPWRSGTGIRAHRVWQSRYRWDDTDRNRGCDPVLAYFPSILCRQGRQEQKKQQMALTRGLAPL